MELWTTRLSGLNRPEIYIVDRDDEPPKNPKYQRHLDLWLGEGKLAFCTNKREMENYIHPNCIKKIFPDYYYGIGNGFEDIPEQLAQTIHEASDSEVSWNGIQQNKEKLKKKSSNAKKRLNQECVKEMNLELLGQIDADGEILSWFEKIQEQLTTTEE